MTTPKIRVGIVGLQPGRSWAAVAHLPALRRLADRFEIVGVANSSLESSRAAAEACGVPQAFASVEEMASSDAIDLAVVTIRVPLHYDAVKTILSKGKHIYCEWPLGRTSAEAEEMAALARDRRVLAAIGTQARVAPAVRKLVELVKGGAIGSVVSSSIRGWATPWGATISDTKNEEYLRKEASGADLLTIPFESRRFRGVQSFVRERPGASSMINESDVSPPFKSGVAGRPPGISCSLRRRTHFLRKNPIGAARSRQQPLAGWPRVRPSLPCHKRLRCPPLPPGRLGRPLASWRRRCRSSR
jgi:hypothetical protein